MTLYGNTATLTCLRVTFGCFHPETAALSGCNGARMAYKAPDIYLLPGPLQRGVLTLQ